MAKQRTLPAFVGDPETYFYSLIKPEVLEQYKQRGLEKLLKYVIQDYTKHGIPVRTSTFAKQPMRVPAWLSSEERYAKK